MPDPITAIVTGYVVANAPGWLGSAVVDKSTEKLINKGQEWLNEPKQQRHLEQVLKKAVQAGLKKFKPRKERDQYKDILKNLFEPGEHSTALLQEAMFLFTLSGTPDLDKLNAIYNQSLRSRNLSQPISPEPINAAPYLASFFEALIIELYNDACFKDQISDVIRTRAAMLMPQQLTETNTTLHQIHETLKDDYTEEQFQRDVAKYVDHMERVFHNLKIVGFLPKEQKRDPDIHGIFVPLRIALGDDPSDDQQATSIVRLLEQHPHIVLLGDPGSGKSTAIRYLAWSHAKANQTVGELKDISLLPEYPLPLRIELRLLMQDRKRNPDYDFLSYATEILLDRNHIHINPLMFERLLQQKRMLVLFDGLDEVTTLDERKRLVEEIEHFTQLYPGNRILTTSRPVGYKLASCSQHLFTHAKVQNFDDEQIHQFLERWYTHVLGLSPLQYEDQQELETLFKTLKGNQRLHKLAENPLLLTVITSLYRSQRLPEKRVQVYEECAELLLENWAKHKGTDIRWKDMKLSKDDQSACVAHLGFQLHKRSEEDNSPEIVEFLEDTATDVPARVLLREIENFLNRNSRKLIAEVAEQHKEAERFLDLMRIEAGLIVERGSDENGKSIYGFVHRTFQEYFAACDVYEHYQQDEDPTIISDFLRKHLHDPHWHEVILLLLAKLKYKPLTNQLRQILNGRIKSHRSYYTNIVQQDLFFVCECLAEDMPVETDLAEKVIGHLGSLAITTLFWLQQQQVIQAFVDLMQTKQFAVLARKELLKLITQVTTDIDLKIELAAHLCSNSPRNLEERRQAIQILFHLAQRSDLPVKQTIQVAQALYRSSPKDSEEERQATQILFHLAQRSDLPVEQTIQVAQALYRSSPKDSEERRQAIQILFHLAQRSDLPVEQTIQAAQALYHSSPKGSEERRQATQILFHLAQYSDFPVTDIIKFTEMIRIQSPNLEDHLLVHQIFSRLLQRVNLPIKNVIQVAQSLNRFPHRSVEGQVTKELQQAIQILFHLAQRSDLPVEQTIQLFQALYHSSPKDSEEERQATQILFHLAQRSDLPVEQTIQAAQALYRSSPKDSEEERQATQILFHLAQRSDLPVEQTIQAIQAFYISSSRTSKEREQIRPLLWQLAKDENIATNQRLNIIKIPMIQWDISFRDRSQAVRTLQLFLSPQETKAYLETIWFDHFGRAQPEEIPYMIELIQQELLPSRIRDEIFNSLQRSVPQFHKIPDPTNPPS